MIEHPDRKARQKRRATRWLRTRPVLFGIGDRVYSTISPEKFQGMVIGYLVDDNSVLYRVVWEDAREQFNYAIELTSEYTPTF